MNATKHCFILMLIAATICACKDSATKDLKSFPKWPAEEIYTYDTIDCTGLDIPAEAITVKQALEIGKTLKSGQSTEKKYYVKGLVKGFSTKEKQNHAQAMIEYGNAYVYIQDNTKTNLEYYGYRVMNSFNTKNKRFDSLDQLKVGDFIVIYSTIKNYNNVIETGDDPVVTFSTNELVYPLKDVIYYQEDFSVWPGNWVQIGTSNTVWSQKNTEGYCSAMAQANTPAESWLRSPAYNIAKHQPKAVKLAFETYYLNGLDADYTQYLKLQISTDGSNWTSIPFKLAGGGSRPSILHDTIDITPYASANTYIAFAYKSDSVVVNQAKKLYAPRWNISKVSIFEYKRGK